MKTIQSLLVCSPALLLLTGCGGSGKPPEHQKAKVSGSITLDGKPVLQGRITFDAQDGQPPSALDILDGNFEGYVPTGKVKVMISAVEKMTFKEKLRQEGKQVIDGPGYDDLVAFNLLPPRYNINSEIKREVLPDRPNEFKFQLKSK